MFKKLLCFCIAPLICIGCGSEPLYAIDFVNPQLLKEADRVEYISDGAGHFYDNDQKDIANLIDVLKHMRVQKIKPDPLVAGGSSIGLSKGDQPIIDLVFAQHISINGNNYQYQMDDQTDVEFKQLIQRLSNSSRKPMQ